MKLGPGLKQQSRRSNLLIREEGKFQPAASNICDVDVTGDRSMLSFHFPLEESFCQTNASVIQQICGMRLPGMFFLLLITLVKIPDRREDAVSRRGTICRSFPAEYCNEAISKQQKEQRKTACHGPIRVLSQNRFTAP